MSNKEDIERIKAKMSKKTKAPVYQAPDLPDMEKSDNIDNEGEVKRLKEKSEDSAVGVVTKVFKQPEVKRVVKFEINREMFISGLFMAFFLVGFFKIFDVAKATLQYNWTIDLAIGVILLAIGGIYTAHMVWQNKEPKS